jgi:shikimate dehydrogenase
MKRRSLIGLIGRNIQGSLSPALFADAFAAAGIDGFYHLLDADRLPERRLPELLGAIRAAGFAGANITYPFKQDILPLLDAIDPEAAQVGAINTVSIAEDGRTTGYNFDRHGWRNSFAETLGADRADSSGGRNTLKKGGCDEDSTTAFGSGWSGTFAVTGSTLCGWTR